MDATPTVTICSSSRFFETAKALARELADHDLEVWTPNFDFAEAGRVVSESEKHQLTLDFLEKIRESDLIYVVDTGGYTGVSVCIEVGFAFALGKHIVMSEQPNEAAIAAVASEIVSAEDFIRRYTTEFNDSPESK